MVQLPVQQYNKLDLVLLYCKHNNYCYICPVVWYSYFHQESYCDVNRPHQKHTYIKFDLIYSMYYHCTISYIECTRYWKHRLHNFQRLFCCHTIWQLNWILDWLFIQNTRPTCSRSLVRINEIFLSDKCLQCQLILFNENVMQSFWKLETIFFFIFKLFF